MAALLTLVTGALVGAAPQGPPQYDVIIRHGIVYDGTGAAGRRADVAIRGDRIAAVGSLAGANATTVVDATSLAVAPGFVNMLSWSTDSLIADGRSQGEDSISDASILSGITRPTGGKVVAFRMIASPEHWPCHSVLPYFEAPGS